MLNVKRGENGKITKYIARLVFRGDFEKELYTETYSPVIDFTLVRLFLSIVVQKGLKVVRLDFMSAFLQAWIKSTVYMHLPQFLKVPDKGNWVCRLDRSLYGLKDAPRLWYDHLSAL